MRLLECMMMGILIFSSGMHLAFADSVFGKTAEEMEGEARGRRNVSPSFNRPVNKGDTSSLSKRREIPEGDIRFEPCPLHNHIVCLPFTAAMEGGARVERFNTGRSVVGYWDKKGAATSWEIDVPESGEYVVEITCTSLDQDGPKMRIQVGREDKVFLLPMSCGYGELFSATFPLGVFKLNQGQQKIRLCLEEDRLSALRLDSLRIIPKKNWKGGVRLYPENASQLKGAPLLQMDFDNNANKLPVLWGSKSINDSIMWQVDIPEAGNYKVLLDHSCSKVGWNALLSLGDSAEIVWKVKSTTYSDPWVKSQELGAYTLKKGRMEVRLSGEGSPRSSTGLMDVYGIRLVPFAGEVKNTAVPKAAVNSNEAILEQAGQFVLMPKAAYLTDRYFVNNARGHLAFSYLQDQASWRVRIDQGGDYNVAIRYGLAKGFTPEFKVKMGNSTLLWEPKETGTHREDWYQYKTEIVGKFKLDKGEQELTLQPAQEGRCDLGVEEIRITRCTTDTQGGKTTREQGLKSVRPGPTVRAAIDGTDIPEPVRKLIRAYSVQKKALLIKAQENYMSSIQERQKEYAKEGKFDEVAKLQNCLDANMDFEGEEPTSPEAKPLFIIRRNALKADLSILKDKYVGVLKKFRSQFASKNDFASVAALQPVIQNPDAEVVEK